VDSMRELCATEPFQTSHFGVEMHRNYSESCLVIGERKEDFTSSSLLGRQGEDRDSTWLRASGSSGVRDCVSSKRSHSLCSLAIEAEGTGGVLRFLWTIKPEFGLRIVGSDRYPYRILSANYLMFLDILTLETLLRTTTVCVEPAASTLLTPGSRTC
jgi:hypothetical protein